MALETPALVVPGNDASHAISAARYLEECLPRRSTGTCPAGEQTADNAPARLLAFLSEQRLAALERGDHVEPLRVPLAAEGRREPPSRISSA